MLYGYEVKLNVVVDAETKEEADKLLREEYYDVKNVNASYMGICNDDGNPYSYVTKVTKEGIMKCYYKPSCKYGHTDCISDPARKKAESCNEEFMKEDAGVCTSATLFSDDCYDDSYK